MGALHEGHADLFRRARAECDVVVGSVFVNPAQFAPHEVRKSAMRAIPNRTVRNNRGAKQAHTLHCKYAYIMACTCDLGFTPTGWLFFCFRAGEKRPTLPARLWPALSVRRGRHRARLDRRKLLHALDARLREHRECATHLRMISAAAVARQSNPSMNEAAGWPANPDVLYARFHRGAHARKLSGPVLSDAALVGYSYISTVVVVAPRKGGEYCASVLDRREFLCATAPRVGARRSPLGRLLPRPPLEGVPSPAIVPNEMYSACSLPRPATACSLAICYVSIGPRPVSPPIKTRPGAARSGGVGGPRICAHPQRHVLTLASVRRGLQSGGIL